MGDFCHFYKFFLCTHNPKSQPLRSLGDLSMNILSCLLLNWKNAECRLPAVHLPNSYPLLTHFSVSPILSSTPSEKGAYGFQGWPATLHLTASTRILPPGLCTPSLLSFAAFPSPSAAPSPEPGCQSRLLLVQVLERLGLQGYLVLLITSHVVLSFALWILSLLGS